MDHGLLESDRQHRHPQERLVRHGRVTALLTLTLFFMLYRSRWGLQVRATMQNRVMARAVGINTRRVDRLTFALGCGVAGVAGAAFTTIGSIGPTSGSLYIVDTFLVVVFGGAASLLGTIASALASPRRSRCWILPVRFHGQGADPVGGDPHPDAAAPGAVLGKSPQVGSP